MSVLSRLPVRLLAFNILLVFLPAAGVLFLDTYERHLLEAQERTMGQEGRLLAFYEASGAFTYSDTGKLNNAAYKPNLPKVEEAPAIARKFLKEHDLLPDDLGEDGAQVVNMEQVMGKGETRKRSVTPNHIVVNFRQKVGGLLTYGPGGRVQVCLGEKGEVGPEQVVEILTRSLAA